MHSTVHKLRALLEPAVERLGYDLVAIELLGGRRALLRLSIDAPGGVGIGDCSRVTHRLGPILDEADPLPGAYDLEVSSPGIDRPVQKLADFARFGGLRARLVLQEGLPRRRYTGALQGVEGDEVKIEVDGEIFSLPFDQIERANLVLELTEYQALAERLQPPAVAAGETDADPVDGSANEPVLVVDGEDAR